MALRRPLFLGTGRIPTEVADGDTLVGASGGGSTITVSDTAPVAPTDGALWFDSLNLRVS